MLRLPLFLAFLALLQCDTDESVAGYGAAGKDWTLQSIGSTPFDAHATLRFPEPGKLTGEGPCSGFSGRLDAPYPWFEITDLQSTPAACPELEAEGSYFAALLSMTQSEVAGNVLILRNDANIEMIFTAAE